jgi:glycerol-1-phosphate dehydrogenase [NAD(P)+]
VSVPTAASMDGYASSVAAMEFSGMKVTFPAIAPVAIFAEPEIVAAAPLDMTRAGIGDLLGKTTARVDWLTAHLLYGEAHCATVEQRVAQTVLQTAEQVDAVLAGSAEAVKNLLAGLIESGKAMAMVESSRPASGCEHHASHFWDLLAGRGLRPHAPHGIQVGYATHFAMRLQRFALGGALATLVPPHLPTELSAEGRSWYSGHLDEVRAVVEAKRRFVDDHAQAWPRGAPEWQAVEERAASAMEVFPLVESALRAARIPDEPGYLEIDAASLKATFRFANRMRSRYTVLDLLEGQGRLEEAIDAVLLGTGLEER